MLTEGTPHTAGYEEIFLSKVLTTFPLPYPQDPPHVPTVSPTAGSMDDPLPVCSRNPFAVRYVVGGQVAGVHVVGFGFRVSGFGFRVSGFGFRASNFGLGV